MSAAEETVRDSIDAAIKELNDKPEPTTEVTETAEVQAEAPEQEGRIRDERGRFVAKEKTEAEPEQVAAGSGEPGPVGKPDAAAAPQAPAAPAETALAPPNGWSAEAKAEWHKLSRPIQEAAIQREKDIAKFTSTRDEHASFGKEIYQTVQPYLATIQAEGGTPQAAIKSLLNTAYVLRTGSPEQKRALLLQTAQQYGVDLGTPQGRQTQIAPEIETLQQRIDRLERERQMETQAAEQRLQAEVQTEIAAFAADPKHPHYETVKGHMAALIAQGAAKDLQDAYEQAVWARPDTRATLLAQQRAEEEQKRQAEAKARADKARQKSIGITGGPGNTAQASAPGSKGSVRDDLEAAMAAHQGGV